MDQIKLLVVTLGHIVVYSSRVFFTIKIKNTDMRIKNLVTFLK